jgi:hypothetical protein
LQLQPAVLGKLLQRWRAVRPAGCTPYCNTPCCERCCGRCRPFCCCCCCCCCCCQDALCVPVERYLGASPRGDVAAAAAAVAAKGAGNAPDHDSCCCCRAVSTGGGARLLQLLLLLPLLDDASQPFAAVAEGADRLSICMWRRMQAGSSRS